MPKEEKRFVRQTHICPLTLSTRLFIVEDISSNMTMRSLVLYISFEQHVQAMMISQSSQPRRRMAYT